MLRSFGVTVSLVLLGLIGSLPSVWAQAITPTQTTPPTTTTPKPKPVVKPKPVAKPTTTPAVVEKAHLLEKTKDWTVYIHESADKGRVCFASSLPIDTMPKSAKRSPIIFYLTTWQKDHEVNKVSVKQGYNLKPNSTPVVTINNQNFNLLADNEHAFIKDDNEETKLVSVMSLGGVMVVKGVSDKGTATTDQYSLNGVAEAIKKMQDACP